MEFRAVLWKRLLEGQAVMTTPNGRVLVAIVLRIAGLLLGMPGVSSDTKPRPRYPDVDIGADSLPAGKQAKLEIEKELKVFYQLHSTDRLYESGI
jgi:hypothetical protein